MPAPTSYQRAEATRIWKNEDTKVEKQAAFSFLWETVVALESQQGAESTWEHEGPKTYVYFCDGTMCWILGSYKRWTERWNRYLMKSEQRTLLFSN